MENTDCPCKRKKCEHHGKCAACRRHHQECEKKYRPACERTARVKEGGR